MAVNYDNRSDKYQAVVKDFDAYIKELQRILDTKLVSEFEMYLQKNPNIKVGNQIETMVNILSSGVFHNATNNVADGSFMGKNIQTIGPSLSHTFKQWENSEASLAAYSNRLQMSDSSKRYAKNYQDSLRRSFTGFKLSKPRRTPDGDAMSQQSYVNFIDTVNRQVEASIDAATSAASKKMEKYREENSVFGGMPVLVESIGQTVLGTFRTALDATTENILAILKKANQTNFDASDATRAKLANEAREFSAERQKAAAKKMQDFFGE